MTAIEWTDETWNPVTGCTHVSPGCDNCYAERLAEGRLRHLYPDGFGKVTLHPDRLERPSPTSIGSARVNCWGTILMVLGLR